MKQLVAICCLCEKVRDDVGTETGRGIWQEFRVYMVKHMLRPEEIMFSHAYCPGCLSNHLNFLASPTTVISRHATERGA
jgi:hypothetical protein